MPDAVAIYSPSDVAGALRQGEILTDLTQFRVAPESLASALQERTASVLTDVHPFAIVMSQMCDLEWDWHSRRTGRSPAKLLPSVLFCEMTEAARAYRARDLTENDWKLISRNKNERYQFLESVPPNFDALSKGLPELTVDFKRYFTLPTDEVYEQLKLGKVERRCELNSPFVEHLATRFHYFQYRVALPTDHTTAE